MGGVFSQNKIQPPFSYADSNHQMKHRRMQLRKLSIAGFSLIAIACGDQNPDSIKPTIPQVKFQQPSDGQTELSEAINRLNQLLQARLDLMPDIALWKWQENQPIEDLERERMVLDRVAELAEKQAVCSDEARLFFQSQIDSAKSIQIKHHEAWRNSPPAPNKSVRPEITSIRQKIDALTPEIIDQWIRVKRLKSAN